MSGVEDLLSRVGLVHEAAPDRRRAAAASLVMEVDQALKVADVDDGQAVRLWVALARAGTGRRLYGGRVRGVSPSAARQDAVAALNDTDHLAQVAAAAATVDRAVASLRARIRAAKADQVVVEELAEAAGIGRSTLHELIAGGSAVDAERTPA